MYFTKWGDTIFSISTEVLDSTLVQNRFTGSLGFELSLFIALSLMPMIAPISWDGWAIGSNTASFDEDADGRKSEAELSFDLGDECGDISCA